MGRFTKTIALLMAIGGIVAFTSRDAEIKQQVDILKNMALDLKQEIGFYMKDVDDLTAERNQLQQEKEQLTTDIANLTKEKNDLQTEINTKTDTIKMILVKFGKTDATGNENIEDIGTTIENGMNAMMQDSLQEVITLLELTPSGDNDTVTMQDIYGAITQLKIKVEMLTSEVSNLEDQVVNLEADKVELESQLAALEDLRNEANEIETESERTMNSIERIDNDLKKANSEEEGQLQYIKDAIEEVQNTESVPTERPTN